jgi:hypothetical protein
MKTMREPSIPMARAGDAEGWTHMVEVAIADYQGCDGD